MADTALSALTATTALASGDLFYVVDGGASRKIDYDNVVAQIAAATKTLTNTTFDANGTGNSLSNVETADIASGSKSGADATLVTGTAGTSGNLASWNVDGDLVDSGSAPSAFATAAQGALADSAVQPGDDANTLGSGAATDGYVLTADGAGGTAWEAVSGGGGTPAGSSGQFQYNNGGVFAAADLWQATNIIEQRNSTNAQTFNLYNTYTDASNYERGFMKWNSNVLEIGTEAAGTGTARRVDIKSQGVTYQLSNIGIGFTGGSSVYHTIASSSASTAIGSGTNEGFVGTLSSDPFAIRTNNNVKLKFDTTGSIEITTGLTVATLPGTPVVGMVARVTDATAPLVGSTVTGGGAAAALVWYNGSNWTVIGV